MTRKDYRMIAGVLNNYSTEQSKTIPGFRKTDSFKHQQEVSDV